MDEWPTFPIELNRLEAMGIAMALYAEQEHGGLSAPQMSAMRKIEELVSQHMTLLRR